MDRSEQVVLCVDDDSDTCELVKVMFGLIDYDVITCSTAADGLHCARQGGFSAIILDYRLVDLCGAEICREIRSFDVLTPVIFFAAEARFSEKQKALDAGANAYLVKPNDLEILSETVLGFTYGAQKNWFLSERRR
jgi:DNA-binding response OmpR family regulator